MGEKKCARCKEVKNGIFFHADKNRKDGLCSYCADCNRKDWSARYRGNLKAVDLRRRKKYYSLPENILKLRARYRVKDALKTGKIQRQPCLECGDKKSQAHHPNYSKPLEIKWLCPLHHKRVHMSLPL